MKSMLYRARKFLGGILDGHEIVEDEPSSGRPCTSKTEGKK
jgi:hypothetical protein